MAQLYILSNVAEGFFLLLLLLTVTYFALFSVQVKLMLTDCHNPDGFNQRSVRIPGLHHKAALPKSSS